MSTFTTVLWALLSTFLFFGYLVVMFQIVVDLFRRPDIGGWGKAFWILGLLFIPIVTALIYVIAQGERIAERQRKAEEKAAAAAEAYVKRLAGTSAPDVISKAKALFDAGTIDQDEFRRIKQDAMHAVG